MGRIKPGEHRIETPVGTVSAILHDDGEVTVNNVPSYRIATKIVAEFPALDRCAAMLLGAETGFFWSRPTITNLR